LNPHPERAPRGFPARLPALAAAFAVLAAPCAAAPELAPLFRDHAVLQSDKPVPVWGRAGAGEHVRVSFAGQAVGATAGADGRWIAFLAPLTPNSSGSDLTVSGAGSVSVRDVVVGEVWLLSGGPDEVPAPGRGEALRLPKNAAAGAAGHFPPIRRFVVAGRASAVPQDGANGDWEGVDSAPPAAHSAAGFFFARDLFARLGVPIGLVESSWPGTRLESWMSPVALARFPVSAGPADDPRSPASLFNGMIHPLLPYAIRGAIWFQGGGDLGRPADFAARFPAMITAWRSHFGGGDFPFYWVQLAGHRPAPGAAAGQCAAFREAQTRALSLPSTGEAVAIDMGPAGGPGAGDGSEIGRRLALIAKAGAYSISEDDSGPAFGVIQVEGPALRVRFSRGGDGLTASGRPLQSFEVAGADRVFHPATAVIDGGSVVVRSAAVRQPVAVRYAWSDAPDANLYNGAGLPAAPFRSDDW
jgi:sialate O-acetylesterase